MIIPSRLRALPVLLGAAAAIEGVVAAVTYNRLGLTLSHYDSRAHLVVARRVIDSITPGWQQIGAVWLPLPHLLNLVPVQVDAWYRSGASAVAISICAFAVATGALAWIVRSFNGSNAGAVAAAVVFATNPNLVYLQSTPMTEPLLLGLTTLGVAMLIAWCTGDADARLTSFDARLKLRATSVPRIPDGAVGVVFALACLTRYEAWPVTACALAAAVWTRWRLGSSFERAVRDVGRIALYPAIAVAGFFVFSRVVIGQWWVGTGFFVPENKALGQPALAAAEILWGTGELCARGPVIISLIGLAILCVAGLVSSRRAHLLVALSLTAAAALPWAAFVQGHPFRIRYMVPLIAAEAIGAGAIVAALPPVGWAPVIAAVAIGSNVSQPFDTRAPMVVEAQWDAPNGPVRQQITDRLRREYGGEKIMASMGSLGHYMQEASRDGFAIRDFLHEGNGDIWLAALDNPRPFAGWILIEEKANGGDMLAQLVRRRPSFLDGYTRICDGAGLALYKRN